MVAKSKRKPVKPVPPSAADLFREAMASENDRERRTKEMARQVLAVASQFAGDGPIVIVGAGICYSNLADQRPCIHCGKNTVAVSVFEPTPEFLQNVLGVPPKTAVAVISSLCDNCINLCAEDENEANVITSEVMEIIGG